MAYIGRGTDSISNVEVLDNITFSGASSYTLQKGGANYVPISAANILVSIDGVVQANNFSVNGSTIDFGVAIANTSTCNFVLHFGTGLITTVQDGAVTTAKIGSSAITSAKMASNSIATASVIDDAITYAKMQDTSAANRVLGAASAGTVGEVQVSTDMIADAQVDESKLKISNTPTNGYMLTAQSGNTGGLTWAEAGGGAHVLLATTNVTSGVSQVDFTSGIDSTYKNYMISFTDVHPATDSVTLRMRISISSTFKTDANYIFGGIGRESDAGLISFSSTGGGEFLLNHNVGNASNESTSGNIILHNPSGTTFNKTFEADVTGITAGGRGNKTIVGGFYNSSSAVDGVRLFMNSGNIDFGTFKLYGIN